METKKLVFNVEDIFEEIPDDPENIILKFPPEVLNHNGWKEGDTLNIEIKDGEIIITKHG
jgi:hypothetical protein